MAQQVLKVIMVQEVQKVIEVQQVLKVLPVRPEALELVVAQVLKVI